MKRTFLTGFIVSALLLGGCASGNASKTEVETTSAPEPETSFTPAAETSEPAASDGSTLIAYFSVTGNTEEIAHEIAAVTGAPEYVITPAEPYTDADIDYSSDDSRTSREQNDPSARPELGGEALDLSGVTTLYLGYPIWWGQEPRIMDTFVETYDFSGITIIPFCTSASSGVGNSASNLEKNAGSGKWKEGTRFAAGTSEDEIRTWIESMQ